MKKVLLGLLMTAFILYFVGMGWAEMISGDLVKIDGSFYVVKDKDGKEHRIHFNDTTKIEGDIKAGAKVEVDVAAGHANSIKAMAAMMMK